MNFDNLPVPAAERYRGDNEHTSTTDPREAQVEFDREAQEN